MIYRTAGQEDLQRLVELADQAKEYFRSSHIDQWQKGEPNEAELAQSVAKEQIHVLEKDGRILAMITLQEGDEPSYREIEGSWLNDRPYMAFHRVCVDNSVKGQNLAARLFSHSEAIAQDLGYQDIRIDTHPDNLSMQRALEKNGFKPCGRIILTEGLEKGAPRIGYQKELV